MHPTGQAVAGPAEPSRPYHHGRLREALIEAGLELTRTGGPAALGLREVTRRVGVSPNAAYRHFADRGALLAAVAGRVQQAMADRMTATDHADAGARRRDPAVRAVARLRAVGLGYIGFALDHPGWFDLAFAGPVLEAARTARPEEVAPPYAALVAALDALVTAGALEPEHRPGAEWPCWSAVHGFAVLAVHGPLAGRPAVECDLLAARTVDAVIAGLPLRTTSTRG
ncbi:AcrR family transcriptional regulator [Friedmanniella endophytica]|uniref:AcrR family transcriptional regulator n=1 Tax=Microlunatus kandeliicorticis TaxID=1759536 RepID=A0A7W3ISK1_9ACTN|nr:TetR/AcrR family transcriptional regulator [Microlunatus kandeliicorticis]MBA8794471.1 AcrR family transcriptional regulator [Microlunatus kandeliicorticis]